MAWCSEYLYEASLSSRHRAKYGRHDVYEEPLEKTASKNIAQGSAGLVTRIIVVRGPERRQVSAEVQFEVAWNAITDIANLGATRLGIGQSQQWEKQVGA